MFGTHIVSARRSVKNSPNSLTAVESGLDDKRQEKFLRKLVASVSNDEERANSAVGSTSTSTNCGGELEMAILGEERFAASQKLWRPAGPFQWWRLFRSQEGKCQISGLSLAVRLVWRPSGCRWCFQASRLRALEIIVFSFAAISSCRVSERTWSDGDVSSLRRFKILLTSRLRARSTQPPSYTIFSP